MESKLKLCKVPKYSDQDCLKILFLLSKLVNKIQTFEKNAYFVQAS